MKDHPLTVHEIEFAAFDMDGTLLEQDSSWVAIHNHFGTAEAGRASLDLYSKGRIDYEEFMRRDISAWPKGTTRREIEKILSHYRVRKEAAPTIERLRKRGVDVALVTSGIDILARRVADDLGIRHWVANGLEFDRYGRLTGRGIARVDPTRKDVAFRALMSKLGVDTSRTIAVGDTVYDLAFLRSAKLGFMLAHSVRADDPRIVNIESLDDLFAHF